MSHNLSVVITAETSGLESRVALAQSSIRGLTRECKAAADALLEAGDAAGHDLYQNLAIVSAELAAAKSGLQGLQSGAHEASGPRGLAGLREQVEGIGAPMRNLQGLVIAAGEAFGIAFAGERLVDAVERTADLGESLLKLSKETGISVETLSGWQYGAKQMGVSAEELDTGLVRLGRNIQEALATPTSMAARAFEAAGISQAFLRESSNDTEAVFRRLAQAFHDHAGGANAAAEAEALLSRSGHELIAFLQEGPAAFDAFTARQKALGDQMTGPMARAFEEHKRAIDDLEAAWEGFALVLTVNVAPALTAAARALTDAFTGPSIDSQLADTRTHLGELQGQLAALKDKAWGLGGIFGSIADNRELADLTQQIEETTRKLAALQQEAARSGGAGFPGADDAVKAAMERQALAAGGGAPPLPDRKPQFGNLDEPISELERFRAELDRIKVSMELTGATNRAVLTEEVALWGQERSNAALTAQQKLQADMSYSQARLALLRDETAAAKQAADQQTADASRAYRDQMALAKSGTEEALAAIRAAHAGSRLEELQAEAAYWRQIVAMARAGTQQQIEAIKELGQVTAQIAQQQDQEWGKARTALTASFTGPAERAFDTLVNGVFSGSQRMSQTLEKAFGQMAESFIEAVTKMIAQWLAFEAITAIGGGGAASALGLSGGPLAALFGGGAGGGAGLLGSLFGSLGAEGAAGGGAIGSIGEIGAAAGGIMAFDVGTMSVPSDMLAMVHQGEMIVPPGLSAAVRGGTAAIGGGGGSGGLGANNVSLNFNVQALDGATTVALLTRHAPTIAGLVQQHLFTHPSTFPDT